MADETKTRKNMFSSAAGQRVQVQGEIEAAARRASQARSSAPVLDPDKNYRKRGENSSTFTMAISRDDKAKLKYFAARRGLNASDLLHLWIAREEEEMGPMWSE